MPRLAWHLGLCVRAGFGQPPARVTPFPPGAQRLSAHSRGGTLGTCGAAETAEPADSPPRRAPCSGLPAQRGDRRAEPACLPAVKWDLTRLGASRAGSHPDISPGGNAVRNYCRRGVGGTQKGGWRGPGVPHAPHAPHWCRRRTPATHRVWQCRSLRPSRAPGAVTLLLLHVIARCFSLSLQL